MLQPPGRHEAGVLNSFGQPAVGRIDLLLGGVPGPLWPTPHLAGQERHTGRLQLATKPRDHLVQFFLVDRRFRVLGIRFPLMPENALERSLFQRGLDPLQAIVPRMGLGPGMEPTRLPGGDRRPSHRTRNQPDRHVRPRPSNHLRERTPDAHSNHSRLVEMQRVDCRHPFPGLRITQHARNRPPVHLGDLPAASHIRLANQQKEVEILLGRQANFCCLSRRCQDQATQQARSQTVHCGHPSARMGTSTDLG